MRTGVCWLVEVDNSVTKVIGQVSVLRGASSGDWSVVSGSDVETGKVFQKKGPFGGVDRRSVGGFDAIHF
jgi:hypothetical protein